MILSLRNTLLMPPHLPCLSISNYYPGIQLEYNSHLRTWINVLLVYACSPSSIFPFAYHKFSHSRQLIFCLCGRKEWNLIFDSIYYSLKLTVYPAIISLSVIVTEEILSLASSNTWIGSLLFELILEIISQNIKTNEKKWDVKRTVNPTSGLSYLPNLMQVHSNFDWRQLHLLIKYDREIF